MPGITLRIESAAPCLYRVFIQSANTDNKQKKMRRKFQTWKCHEDTEEEWDRNEPEEATFGEGSGKPSWGDDVCMWGCGGQKNENKKIQWGGRAHLASEEVERFCKRSYFGESLLLSMEWSGAASRLSLEEKEWKENGDKNSHQGVDLIQSIMGKFKGSNGRDRIPLSKRHSSY
jgi:hypothetical protein